MKIIIMNHLEEIKLRINIEELVGGYIQLKKAGRNLKGLCPFHSEKTPSFMVSPEKGIAYCFGCHQGGDIFKFIQLTENVDFNEAVKILAQKANVTLPQHLPQASNKRLKSIEINQWAARFYREQLEKNEKQKDYFLKRGLSGETIRHFQLGYAPDSFDQLKNHLTQKGYQTKELLEAAVLNQRSIADQNSYDRFRNRLIFPIFDHQDNPIGFSGRIIGEGEPALNQSNLGSGPKYVNSPESPAYNKSLVLYGLNWGKESIKQENLAIFVEGYMDVIAAHQAGTKNVIATCGTAITPQQLKLIQRYTKTIAFAFDQDAAGMEATFRAIELAQMADLTIKVILIPDGKDPDECIQKNPGGWKNAVKNPISVMDFYFAHAFRKFNKENLEGKKQVLDFLLPLIKLYKSEVEQSDYLNRLALELKTDVRLIWNDLKKIPVRTAFGPGGKNKTYFKAQNLDVENADPKKKIFSREEYLLGFIFSYPEIYQEVTDNLIDNIPADPNTEKFYTVLKKVYTRESSIDPDKLKEDLSAEDEEKIDIYALLIEESYQNFSEELAKREVHKLTREINRKNLYNMQKEYEFKIRSVNDPQEKKLLLNRYNELLKLSTKI